MDLQTALQVFCCIILVVFNFSAHRCYVILHLTYFNWKWQSLKPKTNPLFKARVLVSWQQLSVLPNYVNDYSWWTLKLTNHKLEHCFSTPTPLCIVGYQSEKYNKLLSSGSTNVYILLVASVSSTQSLQRKMDHNGPDVEDDDLYSGYNNYNPTFDFEVGWVVLTISLA